MTLQNNTTLSTDNSLDTQASSSSNSPSNLNTADNVNLNNDPLNNSQDLQVTVADGSNTNSSNTNSSNTDSSNISIKATEAEDKIASETAPMTLKERFRKFVPVVVDVETAGFNAQTDALLEIACIPILLNEQGVFYPGEALNAHIEPFEGANLEPRSLAFTGIDPNNPMRKAIAEDEKTALRRIFKGLKEVRRAEDCRQCVLVGHNAHFDLGFLNAAVMRTNSKNHNPFHQFSVFDTVTLAALAFGQTVLARACKAAGLEFDGNHAHSALYDTQKTAELFCHILNNYPMLPNALHAQQTEVELNDGDNDDNE